MEKIKALGGFVYVASVYSKFHLGLDAAHHDACLIAGELIKLGLSVYSPIAASHDISYFCEIPALNHDLWLTADKPLMDAANCLVVAKMHGWRESFGVQYEINVFRRAKKPIFYLEPQTLEISEEP